MGRRPRDVMFAPAPWAISALCQTAPPAGSTAGTVVRSRHSGWLSKMPPRLLPSSTASKPALDRPSSCARRVAAPPLGRRAPLLELGGVEEGRHEQDPPAPVAFALLPADRGAHGVSRRRAARAATRAAP